MLSWKSSNRIVHGGSRYPSRPYRRMMDWVSRIAPTSLPVLVQGESGCGKEEVSLALHRLSLRRAGPFVPINCSALAESLLEAELFGAVRGAYTGSDRDRPGLFRQAHGGTLFLDEVGDMQPSMQAKLLRALESGRIRPVGGSAETTADVRIVAATHRDLRQTSGYGGFRPDLYYRLAVLRVDVPPLRERLDDLPTLVSELAPRLAQQTGRRSFTLTPEAWRVLRAYAWPGNVRELHAALARALLRTDSGVIHTEHLGPLGDDPGRPVGTGTTGVALERSMIEAALRETGGRVAGAAARIGWSRQKLYRRMKGLGIPRSQPLAHEASAGQDRRAYGLGGTTSSESSTFQ